MKDYGESPVKRARLALEGFTWGCPSLPTAADLAGLDEVMVAPEAVMSQQAADLAPGTHVEYRSREAYLIGGWFRAKIVQVPCPVLLVPCPFYALQSLTFVLIVQTLLLCVYSLPLILLPSMFFAKGQKHTLPELSSVGVHVIYEWSSSFQPDRDFGFKLAVRAVNRSLGMQQLVQLQTTVCSLQCAPS